MSEQELLVFNGINAVDGSYLTATTDAEIASGVKGEQLSDEAQAHIEELKFRHSQAQDHAINADTRNLAETGWGVIFAYDADPRIREALQPLLDHRREQATQHDNKLYREFVGKDGYRPGESKRAFSTRHKAPAFGAVDPYQMPYYLLIVGDPETIPYTFQYQLDVQYAVGRIHFDTIEEYARYARSVVEAETNMPPFARRAAFFGVRNDEDMATTTSADHLIKPLVEETLPQMLERVIQREARNAEKNRELGREGDAQANEQRIATCNDWKLQMYYGDETTRANLLPLLGQGGEPPALLFTASHGMVFPNGHERQLTDQGALLCQDWPGPRRHRGPIPPEYYVAGRDIPDDACLLGTMPFFFACYGGGTPRLDEFAHTSGRRKEIAPHAFLSRLPQRLLAHPNGGALAVVAHVERAWGYSFMWERERQLQVFEDLFSYLMVDGQPIGAAIEWFNERYAEISADLSSQLEEMQFGYTVSDHEIARLWTTNNDARSYVILGDPAARLHVAEASAAQAGRPAVEFGSLKSTQTFVTADKSTAATTPPPQPDSTPPGNKEESTENTPPPPDEVQYGLFGSDGSLNEAREKLVRALIDVSNKVGTTLQEAIEDAVTLEVSTYVSDEMENVTYDMSKRQFAGAQLRALTRINLDGDTQICLPRAASGEIDMEVWEIHSDMVKQAQANRAELLKTAFSAASSLLESLKSL